MKSIVVGVLLLTVQVARGQEVVVIPPPPPETQLIPPMQPPDAAADLERRGKRKKLAGALLMGLGGGLFLTGTTVFAAAFAGNNCTQFANQRECTQNPLMEAGVVGMVLGFGSLIAGIPVYVVGNAQVKRAHRMNLSILPALGGGSVRLEY